MYAQSNLNHMTNTEIVQTFLSGFNDPAKIHQSLALLAEDYQFQNPMVQLNSKEAFIGLAQEMGQVLTGVDIIRITENEEWVTVLYEFKSSLPGLERNIGTEWFRVEDGVIKASHLIYDASKWREFYAQMNAQ